MHVPDDKNHPLTLLFICRCIQVHGNVQPNKTPWIHPPGTLFSSWGPETTLCPLSHHVPGHFDGKSAHHLGYPLWFPAPKPYVFLPEHLVLCWYLLHNSYSPQDVSKLFIRDKDHFLCWMSGADVFLPSLWKHGQLPAGSHGHWPLCSYLQSLPLCHCYEPWTLYVATGLLHSFLLPSLPPACPSGESAHFLCIKCYPSLFLWCQPCSKAGLLFYLCQWSCRHDRRTGFCDGPFVCIVISYLKILIAVLKIPSAAGKCKAFSTCSSHLTVVTLFYGSICCVYFQPLSSYTVKGRIVTVNYTILTPMLNPFIYSLRNKDMKQGLEKLISSIKFQMNRLSTTNSNKIHGAWLKGVCVDVCVHMHTHAHTHQHLRAVFYGEILFHQLDLHPVVFHPVVSIMPWLDSSTHVLVPMLQLYTHPMLPLHPRKITFPLFLLYLLGTVYFSIYL